MSQENEDHILDVKPVSGMYKDWFLDYASYVILDRAIPNVSDGLKPVQRRILHSMFQMDDGRFHKVANIIGQTMQYHPHGDASIGDALVNLGQKELLIETQGNWGDTRTGDRAAAPRYIEARLSKFAKEVMFNPQTTKTQLSYDGRKKEPITLPAKFPLLLAQGVEGIAVGLATKILPHNFNELLDASVQALQGKETNILPDFPGGGMADFSKYNNGLKGGKVKIRAKIEQLDKKTLAIREIPYGTTTGSLIDSILKANDSGKIKVKQVVDNTAQDVEILINLPNSASADITMSALYAFTDCEVSVSPNSCVIVDEKPVFMGVDEMLRVCAERTRDLLETELRIRKGELEEKVFFSSLERIFIEEGVYKLIEDCTTWDEVLETIAKGLEPFTKDLYREVTQDDIIRLTEIKIKRISKYDSFKADELMMKLQNELMQVNKHLEDVNTYAINYFKKLKKDYGKDRDRRTRIGTFDQIEASVVAANNVKLYMNAKEGFIGYGLKKHDLVTECSDIDDIIVFKRDGTFQVSRIAEKLFVGKDIIHADVFRKGDERMVYNMCYFNPDKKAAMVKRFSVPAVTRDRSYSLAGKAKGAKVLYFSANPNGEAEIISVQLSQSCRAKIKLFDYNFANLDIKGRGAVGNILTKYPVRSVKLKERGVSTLGSFEIWYDKRVGTLNKDSIGQSIGEFKGDENILAVYEDGFYELTTCELTNRYAFEGLIYIAKFHPENVISALYYDGEYKAFYLKRFRVETTTIDKKFAFISENSRSKILALTDAEEAELNVGFTEKARSGKKGSKTYLLSETGGVKGWKALGNKMPQAFIKEADFKIIKPSAGTAAKDRERNTGDDNTEKPQKSLF